MSGRFYDPYQAGSQSISDRCIIIIIIVIQFYKFQVTSVFPLLLCYIIINTLYRFCIIACNLSWQNISKRDNSPYNKYVNIIVCLYIMATSVITHLIPFSLQEYSATYICLARKASGVPVQLNPVMSLWVSVPVSTSKFAQYIAP